jgi:hypothetical protein
MHAKLTARLLLELSEILFAGNFPKEITGRQTYQDPSLSWR